MKYIFHGPLTDFEFSCARNAVDHFKGNYIDKKETGPRGCCIYDFVDELRIAIYWTKARVTTFGAPRPAWRRPYRFSAGHVENICHLNDPIIVLPPPWLGYSHVGKMLLLPTLITDHKNPHSIECYQAALRRAGRNASMFRRTESDAGVSFLR